jgi:hypothetical protein
LVIVVAGALTACAHDSYTIIPGSGADPSRISSEAMAYRQWAVQRNIDQQYQNGAILAGALFGPGALAAANAANPPDDPSAAVEACMAAKGYAANPDNRP